jgi:tetratricopeptide (TPR) repeat protein
VGGACSIDRAVDEGDRLAREGRWTEAVESYKTALRKYPHSYDAAWGIARIYCIETHHAEKCLAWTEKLLEAYPDESKYRNARAVGLRDRAARLRDRGDEDGARLAEAEAKRLER